MRSPLAAGSIALILLAGCGPKGGGNDASGGSNAVAAPAEDTVIGELPTLKPGSWYETTVSNGGSPDSTEICEVGPIVDFSGSSGCNQPKLKKLAAGGYAVDMACTQGDSKMSGQAVLKGDFSSAYTIDATSTTDEPGKPTELRRIHITAQYLGPCAPEETRGHGALH